MSNPTYHRKLDYDRYLMQEGAPIPENHPDRRYLEADRLAIARLSPEDRALRHNMITALLKVDNAHDVFGGLGNTDALASELKDIKLNLTTAKSKLEVN